ncbi:Hypothetical protein, putative [Bodo saltans]|uniref:Membrane-associated protein n=1 Tax=Bodo saltans TaxID=75058 RepID=A0A0S4JHL4_BODSA|nr:Hypothetical protein, putative [Bodo saltans]|eukprot:CUG89620.1 Hypothetical protein, putative [Bodo saltans]
MRLSRSTAVTLSSLLLKAGKLQLAQAVLDMNQQQQHSEGRQFGRTQPSAAAATAAATIVPPVPSPAAPSIAPAVDDDVAESLLQERHDEDVRRALRNPDRALDEDGDDDN